MRSVLWILIALNAVTAGVAFYVAAGLASVGTVGSVRDVLQVLGGCSLVTVVGLLYGLVSKPRAV